MQFNSFNYLIFFPLVTLIYFVIPHRVRYLWLLVTSYYFYMCWNPRYIVLIAGSTLITFVSGLLIGGENRRLERAGAGSGHKDQSDRQAGGHYDGQSSRQAEGERNGRGDQQDLGNQRDRGKRRGSGERKRRACLMRRKLWVAGSFITNLSILFFFKYFYFALDNLNLLLGHLGAHPLSPGFDVVLPVGISFYTFQALSYTVDVYRGDVEVERNLAKYALFVSFFPQLVAGPIERSKHLISQIHEKHSFDYRQAKDGLILIFWGLFLKLVIADRVAILVNQVFNHYDWYSGLYLTIAAMAFAVQIYCDFGSYSLMAIGSAQVMGFSLMDNFRQPYFSTSIAEFWRRWHISLSTWFRDYLYIPLGGNRKGTLRKYFNTMVVFVASGLWHGANWTFVMWGFLHGLFQVIGQITKPAKARLTDLLHINRQAFSYKLGQGILTFILVDFCWIFFRAPKIEDAWGFIGRMFQQWNPWIFIDGTLVEMGLSKADLIVALAAIFVLVLVSAAQYRGIRIRERLAGQNLAFRWAVYFVLIFSVIVFGIYGPGYSESQFIYFQF